MKRSTISFLILTLFTVLLSSCTMPSKRGMSNSTYGYGQTQQPQTTQLGVVLQARDVTVRADSLNIGTLLGAGGGAVAARSMDDNILVIIGGAVVGGVIGDTLARLHTVDAQELVIQIVNTNQYRGRLSGVITVVQTSPEPIHPNQEVFIVTTGHRLNQHIKVVPFYANPNLDPTYREITVRKLNTDGSDKQ